MPTLDSVLSDRICTTGHRARLADVTVSLARVMEFVASHPDVSVYRIGAGFFTATLKGHNLTEISGPIRTMDEARQWLGY